MNTFQILTDLRSRITEPTAARWTDNLLLTRLNTTADRICARIGGLYSVRSLTVNSGDRTISLPADCHKVHAVKWNYISWSSVTTGNTESDSTKITVTGDYTDSFHFGLYIRIQDGSSNWHTNRIEHVHYDGTNTYLWCEDLQPASVSGGSIERAMTTSSSAVLSEMPREIYSSIYGTTITGVPTRYTVIEDKIVLDPAPPDDKEYAVELQYFKNPQRLKLYNSGTATATKGSTTVAGQTTEWSHYKCKTGYQFGIGSNPERWYEIEGRNNSDTSLILKSAYEETTATTSEYVIAAPCDFPDEWVPVLVQWVAAECILEDSQGNNAVFAQHDRLKQEVESQLMRLKANRLTEDLYPQPSVTFGR